jgi:hypothetical protein
MAIRYPALRVRYLDVPDRRAGFSGVVRSTRASSETSNSRPSAPGRSNSGPEDTPTTHADMPSILDDLGWLKQGAAHGSALLGQIATSRSSSAPLR